jgi:ABC-2 type transport system permease protein
MMQVLYLIPPALLLWKSFQEERIALIVVVSLLVMAAAQLAGGVAWLAISGEDAPDLISTTPVSPFRILQAKVEAVLTLVAGVFTPFIVALLFVSPFDAAISAIGICVAAFSATVVQLWHRVHARRRHFRHRHVSSRMATLCEAFSSIAWASAFALMTLGSWLAIAPVVMAGLVLMAAWLLRPQTQT